jgi:hypothetical protein
MTALMAERTTGIAAEIIFRLLDLDFLPWPLPLPFDL